jgi:hypothetical protein
MRAATAVKYLANLLSRSPGARPRGYPALVFELETLDEDALTVDVEPLDDLDVTVELDP